jgi:hypothetical protein
MSTRDQRRAALDLGTVLVVFIAVSLTVRMLNPLLRRGYGLGSALLLACYQFTVERLAPLSLMLWRPETIADYRWGSLLVQTRTNSVGAI